MGRQYSASPPEFPYTMTLILLGTVIFCQSTRVSLHHGVNIAWDSNILPVHQSFLTPGRKYCLGQQYYASTSEFPYTMALILLGTAIFCQSTRVSLHHGVNVAWDGNILPVHQSFAVGANHDACFNIGWWCT